MRWRFGLGVAVLAVWAGCHGGGDTEVVDTDTAVDPDTDADTDTDPDTDPVRTGLIGRVGSGVGGVDGYLGTETWYFRADEGDGDALCEVRYTLASTAPRSDCADCTWAFDMVISAPEVVTSVDPGCAALLGVDEAAVAALDGTAVSYGFASTYFGHAEALMRDDGAGWTAVTFADFDAATGAFSYDWEAGFDEY